MRRGVSRHLLAASVGGCLALLCGTAAHAQGAVQQYGPVKKGQPAIWQQNGIVGMGAAGANGTFTCPTLTIINGIITLAANGTCGSGPPPVVGLLLVGGDMSSCILVGGDTSSCILVGGP